MPAIGAGQYADNHNHQPSEQLQLYLSVEHHMVAMCSLLHIWMTGRGLAAE